MASIFLQVNQLADVMLPYCLFGMSYGLMLADDEPVGQLHFTSFTLFSCVLARTVVCLLACLSCVVSELL